MSAAEKTLQKVLGYTFADSSLLTLALTHRSVDGVRNNERLEFLGDSVLSTIIGECVFEKFPDVREGVLSRMRSSLVNGTSLAAVAKEFGLSEYLILGPGELKSGGRRRESTLEDAIEAIIGAIYQDSGYSDCRSVVLSWFHSRLDKLTAEDDAKDNKSKLQELLQSKKIPLPQYEIVAIDGKSHDQSFTIACSIDAEGGPYTGTAQSRRQAEQIAAGKAFAHLSSE
ncbi:ribonuclease III [Gammaproteobacteria bacterium 42_54_T18]|nr:ribonuclease III [Gammaproteobacteria bacterium 42_54_T18]